MSNEKYGYKQTLLVLGNVAILVWIIIATIATWFFFQAAAWVFLLLVSAMVYLLLRRVGCNSCAYCKTCTTGFGRLGAWFFGKRELKDLKNKTALAFVVFIYCLLSPISIGFLTVSLIQEFDVSKIVVLLFLLTISFYSLATWRKTSERKTPKT